MGTMKTCGKSAGRKLGHLAKLAMVGGLVTSLSTAAIAEPAAKPVAKPAAEPNAKPTAKPAATATTPATTGATATTSAATDDKSAAKAPPAPGAVNLFPKSVFAIDPTLQPLRETGPRQRGETPAGASFALGDDRDWRVQAAQIGVMTGLFAALVAICNGGACMLSDDSAPSKPPQRDGEVLRQDRKSSW